MILLHNFYDLALSGNRYVYQQAAPKETASETVDKPADTAAEADAGNQQEEGQGVLEKAWDNATNMLSDALTDISTVDSLQDFAKEWKRLPENQKQAYMDKLVDRVKTELEATPLRENGTRDYTAIAEKYGVPAFAISTASYSRTEGGQFAKMAFNILKQVTGEDDQAYVTASTRRYWRPMS